MSRPAVCTCQTEDKSEENNHGNLRAKLQCEGITFRKDPRVSNMYLPDDTPHDELLEHLPGITMKGDGADAAANGASPPGASANGDAHCDPSLKPASDSLDARTLQIFCKHCKLAKVIEPR